MSTALPSDAIRLLCAILYTVGQACWASTPGRPWRLLTTWSGSIDRSGSANLLSTPPTRLNLISSSEWPPTSWRDCGPELQRYDVPIPGSAERVTRVKDQSGVIEQ